MEAQVDHNSSPLVIVECNGPTLLGRNWLEKIKLDWPIICKLSTLKHSLAEILDNHTELFKERVGCLQAPPATIHVTSGARPKFCKARPIPYYLKAKVEHELQRLEQEGIITPLQYSDWAAPVVPVLKPNGKIRLCGDYKITVNKFTQNDVYPPIVEDVFVVLGGGKFFSKIDLNSDYQLIPLTEQSKQYMHTKAYSVTNDYLLAYLRHPRYFNVRWSQFYKDYLVCAYISTTFW